MRYVYIGPFERERYGPNAGDTLAGLGTLAFEAPSVKICAIELAPGGVAAR